MPLPKPKIRSFDVPLDADGTGEEFMTVFEVSRETVHAMTSAESTALAEAELLAHGARVSVDEAREWLAEAPIWAADRVLEKIQEISMLDPKATAASSEDSSKES